MISMSEHVKNRTELILKILFLIYCFVFGSFLITLLILGTNAERVSLGALFLLASVFHFAEFYRNRSNKRASFIFLGLAIIGVVLGIVSMAVESVTISNVCLMFGIMDVFSGVMELVISALILKRSSKNPLEFAEYVISTADIVFGTLLIFELEHGIVLHVSFIAAVFILNGMLSLIKLILDLKSDE